MITWKEWRRKTEKYWKGKKVRTLRDIQNKAITIPAGTILEITGKYNGADLEGLEVCPHCNIGRKIYITRVEPTSLELIND